jgi:hypothetical protein
MGLKDELKTSLQNSISNLCALKAKAFYKQFEVEASFWWGQLMKLRNDTVYVQLSCKLQKYSV